MIPFAIQSADTFEPRKVGAWEGISMSTYQDSPGESNSMLTVLARSPLRFRLTCDGLISKPPSTHDQELGVMIHSAVNEGVEPSYHLRPDTYQAQESKKMGAVMIDKPWNMNANACKDWV